MAAINSPFYDPENGWIPMDQMTPAQLALANPSANMGAYQNPMQMGLIPSIGAQGTNYANLGPSNPVFDAPPSTYAPYTGPGAAPSPQQQQQPTGAPPMPTASPTYANSLPFGSENVGGVGMYTGANAPLDTNRFNTQSNLDFVRSIDQNTYYKYVLPFQQRGGDITNQAAVRQAIEQGMRAAGGGTYAVGSQTFTVGGQPVQQTGPTTPPVAPLPPQPQPAPTPPTPTPTQAIQPFNPAGAMGYGIGQPQQQNPYTNPYGSQYQPPRLSVDMANPFSMGAVGPRQIDPSQAGMGYQVQYQLGPNGQRQQLDPRNGQWLDVMTGQFPTIGGMVGTPQNVMGLPPGYGQQQPNTMLPNPQQPSSGFWSGDMSAWNQPAIGQLSNQQQSQLGQLIANAMARGVMGGQQTPMASLYGMQPQVGYGQQYPQFQQPQQQQQPQYGYNDLTEYGRQQMGWPTQQQSQQAPIDFRAATFGSGAASQSQAPAQSSGSFASQFPSPSATTPQYNSATPWANITSNRAPSMGSNYNYLWGGRPR